MLFERRLVLLILLLMMTTALSEGRVLVLDPVPSRSLQGPRGVRVYLPPSYDTETRRHYPVLYLHDGQNVFSSAGPDCCFGWGNWELDRTADRLIAEGRMREIIMVAVDNTRSRYREYRGRVQLPASAGRRGGRVTTTNSIDNSAFDAYTAFLATELKRRIDREFRTLTGPENTGVMGSSLGGICSIALAWQKPKVFGLAASLSGAFQIEKTNFLRCVIGEYNGRRKPIKIYLDSGVIDYTGDDDGRQLTDQLAGELRRIGWKDNRNLARHTDERPLGDSDLARTSLPHHKWAEARTSQHNEFYWRLRVWHALEFLYPPQKRSTR